MSVHELAEDFVAVAPIGALLGLDPGTKTIGVAVCDHGRSIASPLETIARRKFTQDVERLRQIASERDIVGAVIGLPLNMDGTSGPRAQSARAFARNIDQHLGLTVLLWDERLSTVAAERALLDADASRRKRADVINHVAAAIILQGALERMSKGALTP